MPAPQFVGEHTLGRTASEGDSSLVAFRLPETNAFVHYISDEVTSFCPVTGQPDFYVVEITAYRSVLGLESKSLKMYLQSFNDREKAQFCEAFAHTICTDVFEAMTEKGNAPDDRYEPNSVTVKVKQKARGGISIEATSEMHQ